MPSTINATPTSSGLISSADASGVLELQSGGVTKATISSSGLAIGQYNPTSSLVSSGSAVASTSGTSIDFTSIPSWVKRVTVMFDGVSTNGISALIIQVGTSSGILSSGYNETLATIATATASTTSGGSGFVTANFGANTDVVSGSIILSLLSSNILTASGTCRLTSSRVCFSAGSVSLGNTLDRVRITTFNGTDTFDAGSINILFE